MLVSTSVCFKILFISILGYGSGASVPKTKRELGNYQGATQSRTIIHGNRKGDQGLIAVSMMAQTIGSHFPDNSFAKHPFDNDFFRRQPSPDPIKPKKVKPQRHPSSTLSKSGIKRQLAMADLQTGNLQSEGMMQMVAINPQIIPVGMMEVSQGSQAGPPEAGSLDAGPSGPEAGPQPADQMTMQQVLEMQQIMEAQTAQAMQESEAQVAQVQQAQAAATAAAAQEMQAAQAQGTTQGQDPAPQSNPQTVLVDPAMMQEMMMQMAEANAAPNQDAQQPTQDDPQDPPRLASSAGIAPRQIDPRRQPFFLQNPVALIQSTRPVDVMQQMVAAEQAAAEQAAAQTAAQQAAAQQAAAQQAAAQQAAAQQAAAEQAAAQEAAARQAAAEQAAAEQAAALRAAAEQAAALQAAQQAAAREAAAQQAAAEAAAREAAAQQAAAQAAAQEAAAQQAAAQAAAQEAVAQEIAQQAAAQQAAAQQAAAQQAATQQAAQAPTAQPALADPIQMSPEEIQLMMVMIQQEVAAQSAQIPNMQGAVMSAIQMEQMMEMQQLQEQNAQQSQTGAAAAQAEQTEAPQADPTLSPQQVSLMQEMVQAEVMRQLMQAQDAQPTEATLEIQASQEVQANQEAQATQAQDLGAVEAAQPRLPDPAMMEMARIIATRMVAARMATIRQREIQLDAAQAALAQEQSSRRLGKMEQVYPGTQTSNSARAQVPTRPPSTPGSRTSSNQLTANQSVANQLAAQQMRNRIQESRNSLLLQALQNPEDLQRIDFPRVTQAIGLDGLIGQPKTTQLPQVNLYGTPASGGADQKASSSVPSRLGVVSNPRPIAPSQRQGQTLQTRERSRVDSTERLTNTRVPSQGSLAASLARQGRNLGPNPTQTLAVQTSGISRKQTRQQPAYGAYTKPKFYKEPSAYSVRQYIERIK